MYRVIYSDREGIQIQNKSKNKDDAFTLNKVTLGHLELREKV